MNIHIVGIGGTFMAGVAALAKAQGHQVSGTDGPLYPPMSTQLESLGITVTPHEDITPLKHADICIVGNVCSRGQPFIEALLNSMVPYVSGPEWLSREVLKNKWVLGVSGTHGKTTTSSLLAWILEVAGLSPGFLIGGIPQNFDCSARIGESDFFVVEADEYDTAFFDKRAKFVHYHPRTLIMNHVEYDHADIYPDLSAIETQFHHLVRSVPGDGAIMRPAEDATIDRILDKGCWSSRQTIGDGGQWQAGNIKDGGRQWTLLHQGKACGQVSWPLIGAYNIQNALLAVAAAHHVGVPLSGAINALASFTSVKRRLEVVAQTPDITVYDDFAHHPTAIGKTLEALRGHIGQARLVALIDLGTRSMQVGANQGLWKEALQSADQVILHQGPEVAWDVKGVLAGLKPPLSIFQESEPLYKWLKSFLKKGDHVCIMSNSCFGRPWIETLG